MRALVSSLSAWVRAGNLELYAGEAYSPHPFQRGFLCVGRRRTSRGCSLKPVGYGMSLGAAIVNFL